MTYMKSPMLDRELKKGSAELLILSLLEAQGAGRHFYAVLGVDTHPGTREIYDDLPYPDVSPWLPPNVTHEALRDAAWHDLDRSGTHVHDVAGALAVLLAAGGVALTSDGEPLLLHPDTERRIRLVAAPGEASDGTHVPRVLAVKANFDVNPVTQDYLSAQIQRANDRGYDAVALLLYFVLWVGR